MAKVIAAVLDGMADSPPAPGLVVEAVALTIFSFWPSPFFFSRIGLCADLPSLHIDGLDYTRGVLFFNHMSSALQRDYFRSILQTSYLKASLLQLWADVQPYLQIAFKST